ncbi:unnamed protein product [Haemonchus placei]|uniref:Peroxisomal membrane protein 11B n=1 Tax=Haemonchus placei TaxID=6290 RepID=A0A0N4W7V9_HAEPC|nr:unnamed protein product [Haemonchus placei]
MHESLKLFVSNAIMLSDFLTVRGYKEVPTLLSQFVLHVVGVYMKKPKHLNELSRSWTQSREILRMVCEVPSNVDTLLSILATLKEANLRGTVFSVGLSVVLFIKASFIGVVQILYGIP